MNEDDLAPGWEDEIGCPRQVPPVKAKSVTHGMHEAPDHHLGLGVAAADSTHVESALFGSQDVCHAADSTQRRIWEEVISAVISFLPSMPDQLLIRDVPLDIYDWIQSERKRTVKSQNQFVLDVLKDAHSRTDQIPLFAKAPRTEFAPEALPFTFIDLFAGIGGLRLGLEKAGGRCVFSCEWDKYSQRTYREWFGETPHGDIRQIDAASIPTHDILAAGFPCQPFSIAGVSKKISLGREHGFADVKQGNLFFELARIIREKRPAVLLLENVKNLRSHDQGRTWGVIAQTLEGLGYDVFAQVIDAAGWVPQHRERVFIVGFDRHRFPHRLSFQFPEPTSGNARLEQILESEPDGRYTLSDHLWQYLQDYAAKHREKGNGFGFGLADRKGITRTLSARYFKDGSEILIPQKRKNPRRLTPRECARLMGFPDELPIVVSDTQAYRQFGNAVCPPIAGAVAAAIIATLAESLRHTGLTSHLSSRQF